jgi:nucleoside-diphosphate-sugar epimerase
MKTALVIGGTGPTGPHIVNGLIDRGWEVTILHSGLHEVEFKQEVEHIHTDVHFRDSFEQAIGNRHWDLVVAGYGRLKLTVDVMKGRTGRVIAMGGSTGSLADPDDPRWGPLGRPANLDEAGAIHETNPDRNKFAYQMAQAEEALFRAHREGHFNVTQVAYPIIYGPRQPGAQDWSIVRRVLDKRRHFIIADGGIKLEARAFAANAAHAILLAIDKPDISGGQKYIVQDSSVYTMRQRIEAIASIMGHTFDFVDMPWDVAVPCHILWRRMRGCRLRDTAKIRRELGYQDVVDAYSGLQQSVDWLLQGGAESVEELERQLGDPFDYAREDALIGQWQSARGQMPEVDYPLPQPAHVYRHPTKVNESWKRPMKFP